MLSFLEGTVESKNFNPNRCIINVNGFGLSVFISTRTFAQIQVGHSARVFTSLIYSQEAIKLFGFLAQWELALFELLSSVKGIGPKSALSLVDGLNPQQIAQAVLEESSDILSQTPGVGKKTAERIIFELKNKLVDLETIAKQSLNISGETLEMGNFVEVSNIMLSLGYSSQEIEKSIKANLQFANNLSSDELLKLCLSYLSTGA